MRSIVVAALILAACTPSQVNSAVADGQLVCAVGPTVVAMASVAGGPVLAMGASKAFVTAACAMIAGIPVSPPGAPVPTVTIIPPAVT